MADMTTMHGVDLVFYAQIRGGPRKRLFVDVVTIDDQGLVPIYRAGFMTIHVDRRSAAHLARIGASKKRVFMTVIDKGKPSIKWKFQCSVPTVKRLADGRAEAHLTDFLIGRL